MSAIVTDPQMNPREETWGILFDNEHGFCTYSKGNLNSFLRCASQGTALLIKGKNGNYFQKMKYPILWNGIQIFYEALGVEIDEKMTGPVYKHLNYIMYKTFFDHKKGSPNHPVSNHMTTIKKILGITKNEIQFTSAYKIPRP